MFKLKTSDDKHKIIKERLNLTETKEYKYVVTDDKNLVEEDKINIVYNEADIPKINQLLDLIVMGEEVYITGSNEFGEKHTECRNIIYFMTLADDVYAVMHQTKLIIKMKLYEIEELLSNKGFIRTSKYAIVNIREIEYIQPALNSKLDLLMSNNEIVEVNRAYLKDFKKAIQS
jgi:hypothetical protein